MYALAKHLVLELRDCDRGALANLPFLKEVLLRAARDLKVTVLGDSFHHFEPQGVSGIIFIAESHLSIHTWPEHGYAAVDLFTCGDSIDFEQVAQFLVRELGARNPTAIEMKRGVVSIDEATPLEAGQKP